MRNIAHKEIKYYFINSLDERTCMLFALALYISIGISLAVVTLLTPGLCRHIDRLAERAGMSTTYSRTVWLCGTMVAWPVGLAVFASGSLFLVGDTASGTTPRQPFSIRAAWNRSNDATERNQSV